MTLGAKKIRRQNVKNIPLNISLVMESERLTNSFMAGNIVKIIRNWQLVPVALQKFFLFQATFKGRLRPEPDNPAGAGAGTGTGIPVPVCRNRMWIFKFRFRYERTGFIMSKFRFRFKEPELGHSNSGINRI